MGLMSCIIKSVISDFEKEQQTEASLMEIKAEIIKIKKTAFPLGVFCTGLPIFVLGMAQILRWLLEIGVALIFTNDFKAIENIEYIWYLYLVTGGIMLIFAYDKINKLKKE